MPEDESKEKPTREPEPLLLFPEPEPPARPLAWQAVTPRGIALFAEATFGRLCLVQLVTALLVAGSVVWFLGVAWLPEVRRAMAALPEEGLIEGGHLSSPRTSPAPLSAGRFLGFGIDLEQRTQPAAGSDIYVKFHQTDLRIYSFLGYLRLTYPKGWTIEFNRLELEPRWGAWRPFLLAACGLGVLAGLWLLWTILATLYCPVVKLVAFLAGRPCTLAGCWRLAGAALIPGALLLLLGIVLYGFGLLSLVSFCVLALLHVVLGWAGLLLGPLYLPQTTKAGLGTPANPFSKGRALGLGDRTPGPFG